jgi:hypothetical protein
MGLNPRNPTPIRQTSRKTHPESHWVLPGPGVVRKQIQVQTKITEHMHTPFMVRAARQAPVWGWRETCLLLFAGKCFRVLHSCDTNRVTPFQSQGKTNSTRSLEKCQGIPKQLFMTQLTLSQHIHDTFSSDKLCHTTAISVRRIPFRSKNHASECRR